MASLILKNKTLVFLSSLIISINTWASSLECSVGHIEKMKNLKLTKVNAKICFLKEDGERFFVSSNCKKRCDALVEKNIFVDNDDLLSEFGKPGFKLCALLNGKPELVNLYLNSNNQLLKSDRCVFSDNSFISTEYLLKVYLSR